MNAAFRTYKRSATSVILRVLLKDLSNNDDSGKTGLVFNSTGLIISTICDNEAVPVVYTTTAGTIETIATLGTYAAPTATKCRFKLVDDTNHPGLVEIHLANARFAVANANSLHVTIVGVTDMAQCDLSIPLGTILDEADAVRTGETLRTSLQGIRFQA